MAAGSTAPAVGVLRKAVQEPGWPQPVLYPVGPGGDAHATQCVHCVVQNS